MKRTISLIITVALALSLVFSLSSCREPEFPLEEATYKDGCELGEGKNTYLLKVTAKGFDVTFTIKTDETNLGQALRKSGIVEGDESPYGLYIKTVNGVRADYDLDGAYWAFLIDGEMSMGGVDDVNIEEGKIYELAYTAG